MDLQNSILHSIASQLRQLLPLLMDVSSAVAEIDVLLAWSFVSRDCNLVRAQLTDDFVIIVKVMDTISLHCSYWTRFGLQSCCDK